METRSLNEGFERKGGTNSPPQTDRPKTNPVGQGVKGNKYMKKIIVQEFNYDNTPIDVARKFHFNTESCLPEDYILITTPFKTYMANPEDKIIYIQDKAYSAEELLDVIEKAEKYDGLCD